MTPATAIPPAASEMRPEVREAVAAFVRDLTGSRVGRQVLAVVVAGSAARGEELVHDGITGTDIDLMVVCPTRSPLHARAIARVLGRHARAGIDGGLVPVSSFVRHRTLTNYEARHGGQVAYGDPRILDRIEMSGPADIGRWEAPRLLFNRCFELLKLRAGLADEAISVMKAYEAIGEAELVAENRYVASFAGRARALEDDPAGLGPDLAQRVLSAHRYRTGASDSPPATAAQARRDLGDALDRAMARYLGRDVDAAAGLKILMREERNLVHRAYWTAAQAARGNAPSARFLRNDPCLLLFAEGLRALHTAPDRRDASALIDAWTRCPQILGSPT
jgi:hypothetical protein